MAVERTDKAVPTVARLTALAIPRVSRMLARAFCHDPMVAYLLPRAEGRERYLQRLFRCVLRCGQLYGENHATSPELEGAAVWLPPEAGTGAILKMARAGALLLPFSVGPRFFVRCFKYSEHVSHLRRQHASFPHWFLQLLGVDPEHQKGGCASRLLRSMLERLDREKTPCCLDTANPRNVGFYERFGFRVAAEGGLEGSDVHCWLMVRGA